MAWINLFIAGIIEVIWTISLKYSNGLTVMIPSVITIIGMLLSFYFLSIAAKILPIGTAYAVWTGFGAVGTIIFGIILFGEQVSFSRMFFLLLIISGIIGLKLS